MRKLNKNQWLHAYLDNELSNDDRLIFEEMLKEDPELNKDYLFFKQLKNNIHTLPQFKLDNIIIPKVKVKQPLFNLKSFGLGNLAGIALASMIILIGPKLINTQPNNTNEMADRAPDASLYSETYPQQSRSKEYNFGYYQQLSSIYVSSGYSEELVKYENLIMNLNGIIDSSFLEESDNSMMYYIRIPNNNYDYFIEEIKKYGHDLTIDTMYNIENKIVNELKTRIDNESNDQTANELSKQLESVENELQYTAIIIKIYMVQNSK